MTTILFTALGLGFLGSLHCVGMCGPLVLCLPRVGNSKLTYLLSRLVYNLGRVVTYATMGAVCGLIGHFISLAGYQKVLSITAGVVIILAVILPTRFAQRFIPFNPAAKLAAKGREWWGKLLGRKSMLSLFGIGVLNGLLPCGFLYLGLAAAATTGDTGSASLYMVLFGVGTIPALLITSLFAGFIGSTFRLRLLKAMPVAAVAMALLLVLRGLSLGIPYLSPTLSANPVSAIENRHDCCK